MATYELLILDIDGCLVYSFDSHGLNQAAFNEQIHKQRTNKKIVEYVLNYIKNRPNVRIVIITGRKESALKEITKMQLSEIWDKIFQIIYYPEDLGYEPFAVYQQWKVSKINSVISSFNAKSVTILEDDPSVIAKCGFYGIKANFWFVVKDIFLFKFPTRQIMEFIPVQST